MVNLIQEHSFKFPSAQFRSFCSHLGVLTVLMPHCSTNFGYFHVIFFLYEWPSLLISKTYKSLVELSLQGRQKPVFTYNQRIVLWWCGGDTWDRASAYEMTSSNGIIFRFTGPLCGEFTGPGEFPTQRPVTRSFDVFFDLRLNKR